MRSDDPTVDEQSIDDLVAGQLTRERYREVIRALDAEPSKWRDCALAFLEDQALRAELRELAKGTIDWRGDPLNQPVHQLVPVHLPVPIHQPVQTNGSLKAANSGNSDAARAVASGTATTSAMVAVATQERAAYALPRFSSHLFSTAALLMVSFTVGWLGSELLAERERVAVPKIGTVANSNSASAPASRSPNAARLLPMQPPPMQPQFVLEQPGQFMPLDHEIPQSIRELERRGRVHVESQEGLVPQRMSDGSTVFIPVQEVRVIPATLSF